MRIHRQKPAVPAKSEELPEQEQVPAENEQLAEDVACCLAEIDEVLAEAAADRESARSEFEAILEGWHGAWSQEETEDKIRVFTAKYGSLGVSVRWCCGEPYLEED